jgi:hypothetical protein
MDDGDDEWLSSLSHSRYASSGSLNNHHDRDDLFGLSAAPSAAGMLSAPTTLQTFGESLVEIAEHVRAHTTTQSSKVLASRTNFFQRPTSPTRDPVLLEIAEHVHENFYDDSSVSPSMPPSATLTPGVGDSDESHPVLSEIAQHVLANKQTEAKRFAFLPPTFGAVPSSSQSQTPKTATVLARYSPAAATAAVDVANGDTAARAPTHTRRGGGGAVRTTKSAAKASLAKTKATTTKAKARKTAAGTKTAVEAVKEAVVAAQKRQAYASTRGMSRAEKARHAAATGAADSDGDGGDNAGPVRYLKIEKTTTAAVSATMMTSKTALVTAAAAAAVAASNGETDVVMTSSAMTATASTGATSSKATKRKASTKQSSQNYRKRQKLYVTTLEQQLDLMTTAVADKTTIIAALTNEIGASKERIGELMQLLSVNGIATTGLGLMAPSVARVVEPASLAVQRGYLADGDADNDFE